MLKKLTYIVAAFVVLVALSVDTYAGGGKRNGTGGAQELLIPVSAKGLSLSGAYTSGITGLDALLYNPAGFGASEHTTEAMFSYMNYLADIGFTYGAVGVHFEGLGSLAFSIRSLDFGDIDVTTVDQPYGTGATYSPTFVTMGVTYSNALTDRVRVGVNVNLVSETIGRSSASGVAFDAGVQYNGLAGIEGLKFGIVIRNLGPKMSFDGPDLLRTAQLVNSSKQQQYYLIDAAEFELPSTLELGLAYVKSFSDDFVGILSSSYQNNSFQNDEYKVAGEVAFNELLYVRGGYTYVAEAADNDDEYLYGPTFGVGISAPGDLGLTLDYAYQTARLFDSNHMITVKLGF